LNNEVILLLNNEVILLLNNEGIPLLNNEVILLLNNEVILLLNNEGILILKKESNLLKVPDAFYLPQRIHICLLNNDFFLPWKTDPYSLDGQKSTLPLL
jgi:hypothetical protein